MDNFFTGKKWLSWFLGGLWLLVVLVLVWTRLRSVDTSAPTTTTATVTATSIPYPTPSAPDLLANVAPANYDGSATALVKLVVFSDFDCLFCKAWYTRQLRESLKAEFGDQLAIVFRHYPVASEGSLTVAEASQCAAEQDKFWAFHDAWFEQHVLGQDEIAEEEIVAAAAASALDLTAWQTCRDSGQVADYVRQDLQLAQTTGYPTPPVFYVNGQQVIFKLQAQTEAIRQALLFTCPEGQSCASGTD